MNAEDVQLEAIVTAVAGLRKYRAICPDAIRRIARRELASHGRAKIAVKETKRKLHQVYGAFEEELDYEAAYHRLAAAYATGVEAEIKAVSRDLLARHSSTRERLPILDEFYPAIWAVTGRPTSLLDLGCGLNPLAIPWMNLPAGAHYHAYDIDADRVTFLNRTLALTDFGFAISDFGLYESTSKAQSPKSKIQNLQSKIHWQDVLCQPPSQPADVALLLKTGPCLDRQEPDGARRVLQSLNARFVVVSFAVKSLAGREKGMLTHYEAGFRSLADDEGWPLTQLTFATELVFIVRKDGRLTHDA